MGKDEKIFFLFHLSLPPTPSVTLQGETPLGFVEPEYPDLGGVRSGSPLGLSCTPEGVQVGQDEKNCDRFTIGFKCFELDPCGLILKERLHLLFHGDRSPRIG